MLSATSSQTLRPVQHQFAARRGRAGPRYLVRCTKWELTIQ